MAAVLAKEQGVKPLFAMNYYKTTEQHQLIAKLLNKYY
jgi:hypothetical protein